MSMSMRKQRRVFLAAALVAAATAATGVVAQSKPRAIRVSARRFVFTPSRIALKKGQPVVFELTTEDVFMGMNIPDFGVRSDIVPGKTMRLAFTPDKAGTFTFVCDVFCGEGHEDMSGKLVVT
jgi:cytochrome c oxidase subunit II